MTITATCNGKPIGVVKHITIDQWGKIYEVTNLFDKLGNPTDDPQLASTCVIMLTPDQWLPQNADDVPIYTVH
jgi:hypothetical protein